MQPGLLLLFPQLYTKNRSNVTVHFPCHLYRRQSSDGGWLPGSRISHPSRVFYFIYTEMDFKDRLHQIFALPPIKALGWGKGKHGNVSGIICMCLNDLDLLGLEGRRFFYLIWTLKLVPEAALATSPC